MACSIHLQCRCVVQMSTYPVMGSGSGWWRDGRSFPTAAVTSRIVDLSMCCCQIAAVARVMARIGHGYGIGHGRQWSLSSPEPIRLVVLLYVALSIAVAMVCAEKTSVPCLVNSSASFVSLWMFPGYSTVVLVMNVSFRRVLQKHGSGKVVPFLFLSAGRRHSDRPPSMYDIGSKPANSEGHLGQRMPRRCLVSPDTLNG